MGIRIHCKRAKVFMKQTNDRSLVAKVRQNETKVVPDWVRDDLGYRMGLLDESIIDLTPPSKKVMAKLDDELPEDLREDHPSSTAQSEPVTAAQSPTGGEDTGKESKGNDDGDDDYVPPVTKPAPVKAAAKTPAAGALAKAAPPRPAGFVAK